MKKFLALLLSTLMVLSLVACDVDESSEPETDEAPSSAVVADNSNAEISDEQLKALREAYNQAAPLFNEVYTAVEKNGWMADEQTTAEVQAVNGTLATIGKALTEDLTMLDGSDFDKLAKTVLEFVPALEEMLERVSVPYEG